MQQQFQDMVDNNQPEKLIELFKFSESFNPSILDNEAIKYASENGYAEIVAILLKDKRVDPTAQLNCAIGVASEYGYLDVVEILLNHPSVNPSDNDNYAILHSIKNRHHNITELLWYIPSVKYSLKNEDEKLYIKLNHKYVKNKIKNF